MLQLALYIRVRVTQSNDPAAAAAAAAIDSDTFDVAPFTRVRVRIAFSRNLLKIFIRHNNGSINKTEKKLCVLTHTHITHMQCIGYSFVRI